MISHYTSTKDMSRSAIFDIITSMKLKSTYKTISEQLKFKVIAGIYKEITHAYIISLLSNSRDGIKRFSQIYQC